MSKVVEEGVFKFLTPEEIDEHIKALLAVNPQKGGKGTPKGYTRGRRYPCVWTDADLMLRRQVILDLVGQGLSKRRVNEEMCARWGVSLTSAYAYYNDAMNYMVADNKDVIDKYRDIQISRLESLAEDALAHNDRKSALAAYDQLSKLTGQYVQKIEAEVKEDQTIRFEFGD